MDSPRDNKAKGHKKASKLLIDWAKGKTSFQNINMANILRDIRLSFQSFDLLYFQYILRELNVKVDELSKEVLQLQRGPFGYYEYFEGIEKEAMEFQL